LRSVTTPLYQWLDFQAFVITGEGGFGSLFPLVLTCHDKRFHRTSISQPVESLSLFESLALLPYTYLLITSPCLRELCALFLRVSFFLTKRALPSFFDTNFFPSLPRDSSPYCFHTSHPTPQLFCFRQTSWSKFGLPPPSPELRYPCVPPPLHYLMPSHAFSLRVSPVTNRCADPDSQFLSMVFPIRDETFFFSPLLVKSQKVCSNRLLQVGGTACGFKLQAIPGLFPPFTTLVFFILFGIRHPCLPSLVRECKYGSVFSQHRPS